MINVMMLIISEKYFLFDKILFSEHFNEDYQYGNNKGANNNSDNSPFFYTYENTQKNRNRVDFPEGACKFWT